MHLGMKRETRFLGLDGCNPKHIVGVITRGGLYLDGVFAFEKYSKTATLARKVTETKYFPELRAIMTHGSKPSLDAGIIQRTTGLPVITVSPDGRVDSQGYKNISARKGQLRIKTSMLGASLQDILSLTMIRGNLPEPVRIAHLLGKLSLWQIDHAR